MATKLVIPSIIGQNTENMPHGMVVFLQAVHEGLKTIDNNVVYKDSVTSQPVTPRIRAKSAQGHAYSVENVSLASGDDYNVLVNDFQLLLQGYLDLVQAHNQLLAEVKGR